MTKYKIAVKIRFFDRETAREQVVFGEVEEDKFENFESNKDHKRRNK